MVKVSQIWERVNARRERLGLAKIKGLHIEEDVIRVVFGDGQEQCYRDWETCFQRLRLERGEAERLRLLLTDPQSYINQEQARELRRLWKQTKGEILEGLRLAVVTPPRSEGEVQAVREAWISRYRVPVLDWVSLQLSPKLKPSLSCMDNQTLAGGYAVVGTSLHLATLEDAREQVYARAVVYQTKDGRVYHGPIYGLKFGKEPSKMTADLVWRLQQQLQRVLGAEPLPCTIQELPVVVRLQPEYRHQRLPWCGSVVQTIHIPFLDDPRSSTGVLTFALTDTKEVVLCPPAEAQLFSITREADYLLPLTGEDRCRLMGILQHSSTPHQETYNLAQRLSYEIWTQCWHLPEQSFINWARIPQYSTLQAWLDDCWQSHWEREEEARERAREEAWERE